MGAFDSTGNFLPEACTLCLDCLEDCPREIATFRWKIPDFEKEVPVNLSRRAFLGTVAAGTVLAGAARAAGGRPVHHAVLRPPGAKGESDFLATCVRCGECMKICPTAGLQPSFLEGGTHGMFAPRLVPRMGYCEYDCNWCGRICPTGAIPNLPLNRKKKAILGLAKFDKERCLPFATKETCIVCEEHCPMPDKAIRFNEVEAVNAQGVKILLRQPYVVPELCNGCGICENKCPVKGESAIRVTPIAG